MTGLPATDPRPARLPDVPSLAVAALYAELNLTPKPGLVDRANSGAHRDMDHALFVASIGAIAPWLRVFYQQGAQDAGLGESEILRRLRPAGLACEQAMFSATGGVNTHKGSIFSLGLLCAAAGRLAAQGEPLTQTTLCMTVSALTRGLVARELAHGRRAATAGERLYRQFGLTGARGEVESGFATVRRHVLPFWQHAQGERGLQQALLRLMAVNPDTNLASRGGLAGLRYVQEYASNLLARGWDDEALREMDRALIARNLSPGGSADLLAVSWLLAALPW
ncbi:triphosphoribosyl-dephospho-CoA synthase CitG [Cronobacter turicensis]|nr:triphosphoribosyl-dephospho-CoA synthase CitG [Cronobacter turicensis]